MKRVEAAGGLVGCGLQARERARMLIVAERAGLDGGQDDCVGIGDEEIRRGQ